MAARTARFFLKNGSRSLAASRHISSKQSLRNALKVVQRSSSAVQISPGLASIMQNLGKNSQPSFAALRRIQDLSMTIDKNMATMVNDDGDASQGGTLLDQLATDEDDDQFRWRDTITKVKDEINNVGQNIFAIVHIGGSQFKIAPNDIIMVNKLNAGVGSKITLEKVLLAGGENFTIVGRPLVKDVVNVQASIIEHMKTEKIIVFKKKRRKNYKRTQGHRQELSVLRINHITLNANML